MPDVRFETLNLNLLRVFDALYRERNVTRAGAALGVTQPAVSHALTQLRAIFGDPLFVRRGPAMVPTPLSFELGDRVHAALLALQEALSPGPFEPDTSRRCFTIATGDNAGTVLAPRIVGTVIDRAPFVTIRILPLSVDIVSGLDEGDIDVAINSFATVPERMICDRLWSEAPVWMARAGHPAAGSRVGPETLACLDKVSVDLRGTHAQMSQDGFISRDGLVQWAGSDEAMPNLPGAEPARRGQAPYRVTVPSFYTAIAMAAQSDLVTLLPRRLALTVAGELGLVALDTALPAPERTLMALWHRDHCARPATRWLRQIVLDCAGALGETGTAGDEPDLPRR